MVYKGIHLIYYFNEFLAPGKSFKSLQVSSEKLPVNCREALNRSGTEISLLGDAFIWVVLVILYPTHLATSPGKVVLLALVKEDKIPWKE